MFDIIFTSYLMFNYRVKQINICLDYGHSKKKQRAPACAEFVHQRAAEGRGAARRQRNTDAARAQSGRRPPDVMLHTRKFAE